MGALGTELAGNVLPGGVAGETVETGVDTAQVIDELLPSLHATSRGELYPWSETDLVEWLDEAAKRLARVAGVFVGRFTSMLTTPGQAEYGLPPQHVTTLHVTCDGAPLRPANTLELDALDPAFRSTPGTPARWYSDLLGGTTFGLAPVPTDELVCAVIYGGWPDPITTQQTILAAPPPIKGYLAMRMLAEAYGRESEMEMADVAAHAAERCALYEQLLQFYYGKGM